MKEASIFIKIKDEDIAKLLYFTKPKMKSKMFYKALIYYILNSDNIEEFANPVFKEEFEKYIKKVQNRYKVNITKSEKKIEKKETEEINKKAKIEKIKKDSEEDEEFF